MSDQSVTRAPRTMTAERESDIRAKIDQFWGGADVISELDAERAAHAEIIKAADALAEALKHEMTMDHAWHSDKVCKTCAALAQYAAARRGRPLEAKTRDELGTLFTYLYNAQVAVDAASAAADQKEQHG